MGPHPQYLYSVRGFVDLVDEAVLDINAPGIRAGEIAHQFFVRGWILKGIDAQDREQGVDAAAKPGGLDLLRVFAGVPGKNKAPVHHGSFLEHFAMGVFMFLTRDSRMPGVERR